MIARFGTENSYRNLSLGVRIYDPDATSALTFIRGKAKRTIIYERRQVSGGLIEHAAVIRRLARKACRNRLYAVKNIRRPRHANAHWLLPVIETHVGQQGYICRVEIRGRIACVTSKGIY